MTTTESSTGLRDRLLGLAERLSTPLLPADYVSLFNPLIGRTLRARIVEIKPETADAATIVLEPGRGWLGHVPGQYLRIGVDVNGVRLWRNYSITSLPGARLVSITVKAIPDGKVSNYLVHQAKAGLIVHLDQAAGDFVMSAERPAKALFITGGSGITPVMGMLRSHPDLRDVVLLHSAPTADDVIFARELRALAAWNRISLVEMHTDTDGMLDVPADLDRLVPDWQERAVWACGPAGLLDAVEAHVPGVHVERFRAATIVVDGDGGTVSFTRSGVSTEASAAKPLLEEGEAAGVLMPFGCRQGVCFGCVVPLKQGAVRDLRDGALTTAEPGDGVLIQTCISAAAGPCEIDL